jgi:hypothetical protein
MCPSNIFKTLAFAVGFCGLAKAAPVADLTLTDVNPNSPRSGSDVSPRDYMHQVTAFYFGAST